MKKILILLILFTHYCFSQSPYENAKCVRTKNLSRNVPDNAVIIAKYIVHDEQNSPDLYTCAKTISDFLVMNEYDCSFKMDKYEFDIEEKYVFNQDGQFIELWNYLSEGPLVLKVEELKNDKDYLSSIGWGNLTVRWGQNKKTIIIGADTLKIEKIFPRYKMIWVKRDLKTRKNGRRIIIEYK